MDKKDDIRIGYTKFVPPPEPKRRLQLAYCENCKEYFREWTTSNFAINSAYKYDYCSKCKLQPQDDK